MSVSAFNRHVLAVGAEVEAAMRCESGILEVDIQRMSEGLILAAKLHDKDGNQRDRILSSAMKVVLKVAQHSKVLCALGYNTGPFKQHESGFTVDLADIVDDESACLDLYAQGHCALGANCSKRHPSMRKQLTVVLLDS